MSCLINYRLRASIAGLIVLMGIVGFGRNQPAHASPTTQQGITYVVDRDDDVSGLPCTLSTDDCTLRSAIHLANADPDANGILFEGSERTIILEQNLPTIMHPLAITGYAAQEIQIDTSEANFPIQIEGDNVELSNLILYGDLTTSTLITVHGSAENIDIHNNIIGDNYHGGSVHCGGYIGSVTGIEIAKASTPPVGERAWIYGNTFRCIGFEAMMLRGTQLIVGQDPNGNHGAAQQNLITRIGGLQSSDGEGGDGIVLATGSGRNLIINNYIRYNDGNGIRLFASSSNNIQGNEIQGNGQHGILISSEGVAQYNLIGCLLSFPLNTSEGNIIWQNTLDGIRVSGSGVSHNYVTCNDIGPNPPSWQQGNYHSGVALVEGTHSNTIGGPNGGRNLISDNDENGIFIHNSNANTVSGNYIGTTADGLRENGNYENGILITGGSANNMIGGDTRYHANVISGNWHHGILIEDANAGNEIQCNQIGIKVTDGAYEALPNLQSGITVRNNSGITMGTTCDGGPTFSRNLIVAHNEGDGIVLEGVSQGYIGPKTYVTFNDGHGIMLNDSMNTTVKPYYVVANGGAGIGVMGNTTSVLAYPEFAGFGNAGLMVDLGLDGLDPWDSGDGDSGPNARLNYPLVTTTNGWTVEGTVCSTCNVLIYEGFGSNPAGDGGGGIYLGFVNSDGDGNWSADLSTWSGSGGGQLDNPGEAVYLAIDTNTGNSSEISPFGGVPTAIVMRGVGVLSAENQILLPLLLLSLLTLYHTRLSMLLPRQ